MRKTAIFGTVILAAALVGCGKGADEQAPVTETPPQEMAPAPEPIPAPTEPGMTDGTTDGMTDGTMTEPAPSDGMTPPADGTQTPPQ